MGIQEKLNQIYNQRTITDKEWHLIEEVRKLPFGEMHIVIYNENNQPVRIRVIEKDRNILL